ncbi:MAG: DUF5011 domain-containing protein [Bacilli bacterium]|nr:DUF5011 domain-containing protein [Bacilli bacterium]
MSEIMKNKLRVAVTVFIVCLFIWFLVVYPMIIFHRNEKMVEKAAKDYFELYSNELPLGERVKTLKLSTLYDKAFMKKDVFIPYTKKTCSISNSWVKVKRVNGEFKYYTYLECGVLTSAVDHKGPEIKLVGETEITVDKGEEFKDLGVKSVVDNSDGRLNVKDVTKKGNVDTSKVGVYKINYIAFDSLSNKTTVTRTVTVVQKLASTIKKDTGKADYYVGNNPNNYIYFSNMLFRIIGLNGNDVKIVADKDIANVNYNAIDEWFNYYESHLTDEAKRLIVEAKYCNMDISDKTLDTTQCNNYSVKKKFGLLSIDDINRSIANSGENSYLEMNTITWLGNSKDKKEAYTNRAYFFGTDKDYMAFDKVHNFGVRPVTTIRGDSLIISGTGTATDPYKLKDYIKPKRNVDLNTRYTGEYVTYGGVLWRIVDTNPDGTTKVISERSLHDGEDYVIVNYSDALTGNLTYNPEEKGNVGYIINNRSSEFIDTKYFVNHEIKVPIYRGEPNYNKEVETKKYTTKISSPNMYEMFSAASDDSLSHSFWIVNSTISDIENPGMSEIGVIMYGEESIYYEYGIRPVAFFDKKVIINSGNGTKDKPYVIEK